MLKHATVVFDVDGTLIDTAPDLTNALNNALTRRGHLPVRRETIRATVGRGARAMIEEALRLAGVEDDVDQMLGEFLIHYEANIARESQPFPAAIEAVERLKQTGAKLAICTNKREYLTRKLLQAIGIECRFDAIAGRDTFAVAKPDPGHLIGAIGLAGGDPANAVMVGDSEVDIRTARAAAISIVLVSFGYGPVAPGEPAPDATIDHFDALHASLVPLLGARAARGTGVKFA
jgi:phosphoglycolate phosphatase